MAERDHIGRPVTLADAQIAGLCRAYGHTLATCSFKDFSGIGLDLINPFDDDFVQQTITKSGIIS
jgi:predicted nucleic acid-binding protein